VSATPEPAVTGPILPLDYYPGDATGLAFPGHGRIQAVAEPVRLFGGSALVVHPTLAHTRPARPPWLWAGLGPAHTEYAEGVLPPGRSRAVSVDRP